MTEQRFFGQRVQVTCERDAGGLHLPFRFVLDKEVLEVAEVLRRWHDRGFHPRTRRRTWLDRRHRTFYRVRADDGCIYELYVDRTGGRRDWFITRKAPAPEGRSASDDSAPETSPRRPQTDNHT